MALNRTWISTSLMVFALLAIASLARPVARERAVASADSIRVGDLRRRVSVATIRLEALGRRDSILASLPKRATDKAPLLALDPRLPASHRSIITRAVQRQWKSLRMDSTEVPFALAIVVDTALTPTRYSARRGEYAFDYVLPTASTGDRSRCVAIVTLHSTELVRADRRAFSELFATPNAASQLLGPCAFVARFGVAGPEIDRWLRTRGYDLAAYPRWYTLTEADGADMAERWHASNTNNDLMGRELWLSREAMGCAAGITHHCAATLSARGGADSTAEGELIMMHRGRDAHWATLAPRYLSDLVTALGPADFRRFWQSTLPPDAAFAAVAARPLEVWTHQWAVGLIGEQRVGAAVSFPDLAGALVLAGLSLAIAAWGWSRRQVR
jgi:hypothetical protein